MSNIPPERLRDYQLGLLPEDQAEELERQLAEQTLPPGETIQNLEVAEDTLVMGLRKSLDADPLLAEPQLDRVLQRIDSLGHDPSLASIAEAESPLEMLGPYRLLEKLGEGGMGTVYKALHTRLKKIVALKVLPSARLQNADAVARFEREMEAAGRLDHPNLIRAMDAGEHEGRHFLVMEYIQGHDLAELSRQCGPLPVPEACELIRQAALGLQDAFEHGLVHRDIKPSNLFLARSLGKDPIVKVLDLGLARLADAVSSEGDELTTDGQIMGTLDYMAPEQGGDTHNVDIRADIYALGASLYKLLTGHAVYSGEAYRTTMQKLTALVTEPAPSINLRRSDIPEGLAELIHRMLEKSPAARPATPREVAEQLLPFALNADLQTLAEGPSPEEAASIEVTFANETIRHSSTTATEVPRQPSTMVRGERGDGGRFKHWRWIAGGAMAASLLLGVILLQLRTPHGTIVLEIAEQSAAEIETRFAGGGIEILDKGNDRVWTIQTTGDTPEQTKRLPDGTYKIRTPAGLTVRDTTGAKFDTDQFELRSGEQLRLRVVLEPLASKSQEPGTTPKPENVAAQQPHKASASELDSLDWSKLTSLQLNVSDLTKDGWDKLARGINLEDLVLTVGDATQPSFSQAEMAIVASLPKLKRLSLPTSAISLHTGDALKASDSLRELILTGLPRERFTELQADIVWGLPNISAITWIGATPTPNALMTFQESPHLSHLSFHKNYFEDDNLEAIANFPRLTHLDLRQTAVSPQALDRLRESRQDLQITGDVPTCDYDAEREVALWLLQIPAEVSNISVKRKSDPKPLRIYPDRPLPDEPFVVHRIYLGSPQAPQGDWSPLTRLSGLQELKILWNSNFTDASLSKLGNIRNTIVAVECHNSSLRGPGFSALTGAPRLRSIHLAECLSINDTALQHFATMPQLIFLEISHTQVTDSGLKYLAAGQPPLSHLSLPPEGKITAEGVRLISQLKSLEALGIPQALNGDELLPLLDLPILKVFTLSTSQIQKDNIEILRQHPSLRDITISPAVRGDSNKASLQAHHIDTIRLLDNLRGLHLYHSTLDPEAAERLAEIPNLEEITLGKTTLTPQMLQGIAKVVKLKILRVDDWSRITKTELAAFQAARPDVEVIGANPIDPVGTVDTASAATDAQLESLDWSKVKSLQLDVSTLTKDGWARLARGIHLENLELKVNAANQPSFSQAELATIAKLPKLNRLSLPTSLISLEVGNALTASQSLRELVLTGTPDKRFTEIQADAIWGIPNLSAITWLGTIPTTGALDALLDTPQVTHMSFHQSTFGDEDLDTIVKFESLTHLDFQGTDVSPFALEKLRETRNELQISGDVPAVDYAAEREVAQWLLEIPAEKSIILVQLRSEPKPLRIYRDRPLPDEPFTISELYLTAAQAPQGDWSPLTRLCGLKKVAMHGASNFTDTSLSKLSNIRNSIESIWCFESGLRGPGFAAVAGAPRLEMLHLYNSQSLNDTALVHFATMPKLTFLNIGGTQVTDAGLERLAEGRPPLEFLELPSNSNITVKGMQAVSRLKSLIFLVIHGQLKGEDLRPILDLHKLEEVTMPINQVTKDKFEILKDHPNLKGIAMDRRPWGLVNDAPFLERHLEVLRVMHNLKILRLSIPLSPEAAERLGEFPNLEEMHVGATEFTPEILDGIANAKKLARLYIGSFCRLSQTDFDAFQAKRPDIEVIGAKPTDP